MRKLFSQFFRLWHINFILARYSFDQILFSGPLYPFRFLAYLNPFNWFHAKKLSRGARLRFIFQELGPIFVKFGQALSTRHDFIPDDIIRELALLQDEVPPFKSSIVIALLEKAYRQPLTNIFTDFNPIPLASASVAQVHTATLPNGKSVVVKIIRPNIQKVIRRDVELMYTLAKLIGRYMPGAKRLHLTQVVEEFARTIFDELNLNREAANASQLRRNFLNSPFLYIPDVYWDHMHHNVMVMERIDGIRISDLQQLQKYGINLKKLAECGVEIFFTQVFRDCFFHADMHPGNIFVNRLRPNDPQYIAVDFGIIGTLSPTDQRYLAENFLAFFHRDYRRVAELHIESGWVRADIRVEDFESGIRTVCEPVFERPLKDISFGKLLVNLFHTAKRFDMEVQPQLILLQKTLLNVEGLGRKLYPELDLWQTAKPFLERWLKDQIGVRAFIRKSKKMAPLWLERMPEIPDLVYHFLSEQKLNRYKASAETHQSQHADLFLRRRSKIKKRLNIFGILLLGISVVTVWWPSFTKIPFLILHYNLLITSLSSAIIILLFSWLL